MTKDVRRGGRGGGVLDIEELRDGTGGAVVEFATCRGGTAGAEVHVLVWGNGGRRALGSGNETMSGETSAASAGGSTGVAGTCGSFFSNNKSDTC